MKDMNLLEILTDILYYPFKNNFYNIKNLSNVKKEMISVKKKQKLKLKANILMKKKKKKDFSIVLQID